MEAKPQTNMSNDHWQKGFLSELTSSFPREIQGLIGNLNSRTCNNYSFKRLFEEKNEICWKTFVNHLIRDYPVVIDDNELFFKPKLMLFPLHLQRNILSMLLTNVRGIPVESIRKLDESLNQFKGQMHEWTDSIHKLLKVKINELQNDNSVKKHIFHTDIMTAKSRPVFQELYGKIKSCKFDDNVEETSKLSWNLVESPKKTQCITNVCDNDDDSLVLISDVSNQHDEDTSMDIDVHVDVKQIDCMNLPECASSYNVLPEPPPELNIDDVMVIDDSTALHSKLIKLQELLKDLLSSESSQVDNSFHNDLQVFSELPGSEMEEACNILGLSNLCNENAVAILIQGFVKINPEPSYQNTNVFALKVILPSLQKITCSLSRILANSVMMFCEKFSNIASANLVFHLLIDPLLNTFQTDFICKVIREKFNVESNSKILSLLLDATYSTGAESFYWNDNIVTVVQAIIDSDVMHEQEMLHTKFVNALKINATFMSKSLKFTKLVVSVMRKYSSLVCAHKQSFITILDRNETFLRKAGMTSLKKIH